MKRKQCMTAYFPCEDDMEELNAISLIHRKESAAPLTTERDGTIFRHSLTYPLALVLRLRVLQIVCGISKIVMGSVAFIEERQKFNMSLGIPAGSFSVLAAALSIHTSKGWGMVSSGAVGTSSAAFLWMLSVCMILALLVQCFRTICDVPSQILQSGNDLSVEDTKSSRDLIIIASIQIVLALITLLSAFVCARIDFYK